MTERKKIDATKPVRFVHNGLTKVRIIKVLDNSDHPLACFYTDVTGREHGFFADMTGVGVNTITNIENVPDEPKTRDVWISVWELANDAPMAGSVYTKPAMEKSGLYGRKGFKGFAGPFTLTDQPDAEIAAPAKASEDAPNCEDCKHRSGDECLAAKFWRASFKATPAAICRETSGHCGPEGRHFSPKPTEEPMKVYVGIGREDDGREYAASCSRKPLLCSYPRKVMLEIPREPAKATEKVTQVTAE